MADLIEHSAARRAILAAFSISPPKGARTVVQKISRRRPSPLESRFNTFLFASIDEGANEAPLSVVSALARLDLDPWQEATDLAALPVDTAAQRLVGLLTKLPYGTLAHSDPQTIATRLIALLPLTAGLGSNSVQPSSATVRPQTLDPTKVAIFAIAGWAIAITISGFSGHPKSAQAIAAPSSAPGAGMPTASAIEAHH